MSEPYRPVDCGFHDRLLALATLRTSCEVVYRDEGGRGRRTAGVIADVYTKGDEEFLLLEDGTRVRLDRLVSVGGHRPPGRAG